MWNLVRGWFPFAYRGGASSAAVSRFCIYKTKILQKKFPRKECTKKIAEQLSSSRFDYLSNLLLYNSPNITKPTTATATHIKIVPQSAFACECMNMSPILLFFKEFY